MNKYVIKTLKSEDFDLLPYSRVRESVGVTDRLLGVSYIRDTGDVDEDLDTLLHEILEMENKKSPFGWSHEDKFGVRYKSWFQKTFIPESKSSIGAILGTAAGMALAPFTGGTSLAFLNPATLGTLGGGIGGYQESKNLGGTLMGGLKGFGVGSLGTGLQAMAGPATGLKGNLGEFWQGVQAPSKTVGSWLTPAPKTTGVQVGSEGMQIARPPALQGTLADASIKGTNAAVNPLLIGGGEQVGGLSSGMNAAYNASRLSSGLASPALAGFTIGANVPTLRGVESLGASGVSGSPSVAPTTTANQSLWSKFFRQTPESQSGIDWGKIATGAGISMAGNALAPKAEMPTTDYLNQIKAGGLSSLTPAGQLANKSVTDILNTQWTGLPQEYKDSLLADLTYNERDEERALRAEYKSLRPYADIENDTAFKRDFMELKDQQKMRRDNLLAKAEQQEWERFNTQKTATISQAMGIDQNTLNQYMELANADLQIIMFKTGLSFGEAQQFKDVFGQIGGTIMKAGLPSTNLDKFSINLG
jgi:hypothetical protein